LIFINEGARNARKTFRMSPDHLLEIAALNHRLIEANSEAKRLKAQRAEQLARTEALRAIIDHKQVGGSEIKKSDY